MEGVGGGEIKNRNLMALELDRNSVIRLSERYIKTEQKLLLSSARNMMSRIIVISTISGCIWLISKNYKMN